MERPWKKVIRGNIIALLLACLCLPALPALAGIGIGVAPSNISIDNALRGIEYEESIIILNTGDQVTDYAVTVQGEIADWLSLSYKGGPASRITVPSGNKELFQVKIAVPEDAANKKYAASVVITSIPTGRTEGSGQALAVSASSLINITVTGTQIISGRVDGVTIEDTEIGFPLVLRLYFQNTGNVEVAPSVNVTLSQNSIIIDSFSRSDTHIRASKGDFIRVDKDTTGLTPGDFDVNVSVSLEGEEIFNQDLNFTLLPVGTLTCTGELRGISTEGNIQTNTIVKIRAIFANTGSVDVWSKLTGEVYYDGSLIQIIESEQLLVEKGMEETLVAYFEPEKEGKYTIESQIMFGGKKTEMREITLDVQAGTSIEISEPTVADTETPSHDAADTDQMSPLLPPDAADTDQTSLLWPVLGGIAGMLVISGVFVVWRRRRY